MLQRFVSLPATAESFVPGDGEGSASIQHGTFTASTWDVTEVDLDAASNPSAAGVVAGSLIINTDDGAWGIAVSAEDTTDIITVKRWYKPGSGNSLPYYVPSGTTAGAVHGYPSSYIAHARSTIIDSVTFSGTGGIVDIYDASGDRVFTTGAASTGGTWTDLELPLRGPWYVTTTGSSLAGSIVFQTVGEVTTT